VQRNLIVAEGGAPAALAGVMMYQIDGDRGIFTAEQVRAATRDRNRYAPRSRLVSVEQTSNAGGGSVWPLATIEAVAEAAREAGLALHMDGARLMNAAVASGVAAADFARPFDTVWMRSTKPGSGNSAWAVLCAKPASLPPQGSTPSTTMSSAWPTITPTPRPSPRPSPRSRA
jgi:threonine aldolase